MSKNKFSVEERETINLALDVARYDYAGATSYSKEDMESNLRNRVFSVLGIDEDADAKTIRRAFRRNKIDLYEIIEEVVETSISTDVLNTPFMQQFVEIKNRALGDTTRWIVEPDSYIVAHSFAGNHWATNRQKLASASGELELPAKWVYVRVYDEFERFLLQLTSMDRFMDAIYKAINRYIQESTYAQFKNLVGAAPSYLTATGNGGENFVKLVELVAASNRSSEVTIVGTRLALRKLIGSEFTPAVAFANSQKEAFANTGSIQTWEGYNLMVLPQVLQPGTLDKFALDDSKIFILGGAERPIKVEIHGDTRTIEHNNAGTSNGSELADQTIDVQVQTKIGMGILVPTSFGVYTIA